MPTANIETRSFIAGEFAKTSGGSFTLKNPATGETVCEVPIASKADVDRAVAAASAAQPAWAALPAAERAACLNRWADLIDKNVEKIVHVDAVSVGKPVGPQTREIGITAARIRYEATLAQSLVGESSTLTPGQLGLVLREPYGVTAGICPWNVPTIMLAGKAAPAVAAGNAIIIKSSEKSPLSSLILAGLTVEAGFPPGIIQVLSGMGETGAALAEHPEIRKISFTGSTRTGRRVAEAAAKSNLKAVSLELGGKSPTILFEDADLEQAVPACAFSLLWNSGQICMANTRLYVHEKIADKFLEMFKQCCGHFKQGDPLDPETFLGPQADEIQGNIVRSYLEAGKKEGKIEMGGEAVPGKGQFIQPTIYTNVSEDAKVNKEEIFGPVAVVHRFTDEAEVIRRANDSEYGLYASVWTQDIDRAVRVARKLEAGTVGVNATSPSTANELVFGGYKQSGWAREGGVNSLHLWTQQKSVVIKYKNAA